MSIPFTQSVRSMKHDRFLPGLIAILMISLVLVLWLVWFFTGTIAIYATTMNFSFREDGMALGQFPAESLRSITPGQSAELLLPAKNGKALAPIKAEVMNIPTNPAEPVELYLFAAEPPPDATKGQLKILLGKVSPIQLIWDSIQK